ncbi:MAG: DUF2141 domain-containing protein [Comamonadaceae bacterium]|nr:DUF2141 domain-containing protein [Comamonadaceae bacterium]
MTVTGFLIGKGRALVALFVSAEGWPDDEAFAFGRVVLLIRGGEAVAEFEDVPAGPFAVSAFHDEDVDRVLDTGPVRHPLRGLRVPRATRRGSASARRASRRRASTSPAETKRATVRVRESGP